MNTPSKMNTMFQIGDCLIFQGDDGIYYGLIFYSIEIKIGGGLSFYSFVICGKKFDYVPDHKELLQAGILGNNDKSLDNPNGEQLFDCIYIQPEYFLQMTNQFVKIGEISIEEKPFNHVCASNFVKDIQELTYIMNFTFKYLGSKRSENSYYHVEIFPIDSLMPKSENYIPKTPNEYWVFSKKNAHPKALELLNDDYWNETDYTPFGNDLGKDTLHSFQEWRVQNQKANIAQYVYFKANSWNSNIYNLNEKDAEKIDGFLDISYAPHLDDVIISICFGQLVLEGKIENGLKLLGIAAIFRQLHPKILNLWPSADERREILNNELEILKEKL